MPRNVETNFDDLKPRIPKELSQFVTRFSVERTPIRGKYYIYRPGFKHECRVNHMGGAFSYGPVDADISRMGTVYPGTDVRGTELTHGQVIAAIKAVEMVHALNLVDVRQEFEDFVNAPIVAGAPSPRYDQAASPVTPESLVA